MNNLPPRISRRLLPLSLSAAAFMTSCATVPADPAGTVQIQRTTYGVAHITANDYEGIAYGVAYAHAQDNVCQTANQLVTVRGERSKFFGGTAEGLLGLRLMSNEQIDFFVRFHMDDSTLQSANRAASADARANVRGLVAGYNRYLADTGVQNLPPPCKGAAWARPMTEADLYRMQELSMIQLGVGLHADAVLAAGPPKRPGAVAAAPGPTGPTLTDTPDPELLGSNGWAFGKDATPDGRGLLLGNPHFPWAGANRFWQMHLTIPGKLDVMGASIGSAGFVQVGFNKDVAWTHTVSTGKRFTLHELTLDPADPTAYLHDGVSRKMVPSTIEIESMSPDGVLRRKQHTFWKTAWGPVLAMPRLGLAWTASKAYAIQDANTGNARFADAWLAMNKARSVEDLRKAISNSSMPWANTIAADRHGAAMYADLSVVPDVSATHLKRCAPSPAAAALMAAADVAVLDGSKSTCGWERDPAAPVPGLMPAIRMPVLIRSDWVQNSNDSYWLSNPSMVPEGISPMLGSVNNVQRLRTRVGIEEIRRRLDGKDGLAGNRMGMKEVQAVLFRNRNKAADLVLDDVLGACAGSADADVREGCNALKTWDRASNAESRGAPLFREFWRVARDTPKVWRVPFNPALPVDTPVGVNAADPAVRASVLDALGKAVRALRKGGFTADATLGSMQYRDTNAGRIGVHGGDEYEGVLNKVGAMLPTPVNDKGFVLDYGASYLQAVTFDARGPVAEGMLTYGQSSNPNSAYAYDQLQTFAGKRWPTLPFHAAEVAAQATGPAIVLTYSAK